MILLSPPLKAFVSVSQNGTVHGAARDLGLTQTGVTQRIRALEKQLKTTLFVRSRRGMTPTFEGEALLRYCKDALLLEGQFTQHLNPKEENATIQMTLVGPTSIMTSRIVSQLQNVYSQFPKLNLNLRVEDSEVRLLHLRSGLANFAIVSPEQVANEMESKKLKPDKYVLVATKKWKGKRIQDILSNKRAIDFEESDPTTLAYLKKHSLISHLRRPRLFVNNNDALIKLFIQGVGFGTLTVEVAKPHLESGSLIALNQGAVLEDPQALVWYQRHEMPHYFREIIEAIS